MSKKATDNDSNNSFLRIKIQLKIDFSQLPLTP